ncbi:hypothetical protein JZ751_024000 [Albula glossodonta]|uniref:Uncharacterized protein n=1 Tax=Albula glossodonta TaxID=121402 RepID=A0A8T2MR33_9TELE|nr:hypothetical protein JZ751_024000 [Albula glossodonta]
MMFWCCSHPFLLVGSIIGVYDSGALEVALTRTETLREMRPSLSLVRLCQLQSGAVPGLGTELQLRRVAQCQGSGQSCSCAEALKLNGTVQNSEKSQHCKTAVLQLKVTDTESHQSETGAKSGVRNKKLEFRQEGGILQEGGVAWGPQCRTGPFGDVLLQVDILCGTGVLQVLLVILLKCPSATQGERRGGYLLL